MGMTRIWPLNTIMLWWSPSCQSLKPFCWGTHSAFPPCQIGAVTWRKRWMFLTFPLVILSPVHAPIHRTTQTMGLNKILHYHSWSFILIHLIFHFHIMFIHYLSLPLIIGRLVQLLQCGLVTCQFVSAPNLVVQFPCGKTTGGSDGTSSNQQKQTTSNTWNGFVGKSNASNE